MSYFDTFTATLFRTDADGRRVIAPFGRGRVYLVGDASARRIEVTLRIYYGLMLIAIVTTQVVGGWRWNMFFVWPLSMAIYFALFGILVRPLERLPMSTHQLHMESRSQRLDAVARATGKPTLVLLAVTSLTMTLSHLRQKTRKSLGH